MLFDAIQHFHQDVEQEVRAFDPTVHVSFDVVGQDIYDNWALESELVRQIPLRNHRHLDEYIIWKGTSLASLAL